MGFGGFALKIDTIVRSLNLAFSDDQASGLQMTSTSASIVALKSFGLPTDMDLELGGQGAGQVKIGSNVVLHAGNIGSTVQAYHANLAAVAAASAVSSTAGTSRVPISSANDGRLADAYMRHFFMTKRLMAFCHDPGGTTWSIFGTTATMSQVGTGTPTSGDSAVLPSETQTTGTTIGNAAGRISSAKIYQRGWSPIGIFKVLTAASIANLRIWVGFTDTDVNSISTLTTQHCALFGYDTGRDGTAFWRCFTCDGTTVLSTTTSIAITNSTTWNLRIEIDDTAAVVAFYINDVLAVIHSTNLPGQTTLMYHEACVTTLASAAKKLSISSIHVMQN